VKRVLLLIAVVAASALVAWLAVARASATSGIAPRSIAVRPGDEIRVAGLVRFESNSTGKLLYRAAHHGSIRKCGTP
jgi:hypothetical protein